MKREGMTFYSSWLDQVRNMSQRDGYKYLIALLTYGLEGEELPTTGIVDIAFTGAKPIIEAAWKRSDTAKKGGRPPKEKNSSFENKKTIVSKNEKPEFSEKETEPLNNINIKDNIKDNIKINNKEKDKEKGQPQKKDERLVFVESLEDDWRELCVYWIKYKNGRGEHYKTAQSLQVFVKHLRNYSGENISVAREIVEQSMANNWAGIFPLKTPTQKMSNLVPLTENYEEDKKIGFQV